MVRDVPTRWNSTAELIQRALELSAALKILVVKVEHNKPGRGVRLKHFQLSPDEWKLLSELSPLLDVSPLLRFSCTPLTTARIRSSFWQRKKYRKAKHLSSIK